jgi:hypothetical protein
VSNFGLHEAERDQVGGETIVPSSRHLLQAIEGLIESAHQFRVGGVNEVGGLREVGRLSECAIEEGVVDVELVHEPTPGDG